MMPRVGDKVLFTPSKADALATKHFQGQQLLGFVVKVWDNFTVNLVIFDTEGFSHSMPSVSFVQPAYPKPDSRYCEPIDPGATSPGW